MCRVRVGGRRKDGLAGPGGAAVQRPGEAELRRTVGLKARPGDVNIVPRVDDGIRSDRNPLLVAAIVLLDHDGVAPCASTVGGLVRLDCEGKRGSRAGSQAGEVEVAVTVL